MNLLSFRAAVPNLSWQQGKAQGMVPYVHLLLAQIEACALVCAPVCATWFPQTADWIRAATGAVWGLLF